MKKIKCLILLSLFITSGCQGNVPIDKSKEEINQLNIKITRLEEQIHDMQQDITRMREDIIASATVDIVGKTPKDVMVQYIKAKQRRDWKAVYEIYQVPGYISYKEFMDSMRSSDEGIVDFKIGDYKILSGNHAVVYVTYTYKYKNGKSFKQVNEPWVCVKVNGKWKVRWLPRQ